MVQDPSPFAPLGFSPGPAQPVAEEVSVPDVHSSAAPEELMDQSEQKPAERPDSSFHVDVETPKTAEVSRPATPASLQGAVPESLNASQPEPEGEAELETVENHLHDLSIQPEAAIKQVVPEDDRQKEPSKPLPAETAAPIHPPERGDTHPLRQEEDIEMSAPAPSNQSEPTASISGAASEPTQAVRLPVPGLWLVTMGPSAPQVQEMPFEVDEEWAAAAQRWAKRSKTFECVSDLSRR